MKTDLLEVLDFGKRKLSGYSSDPEFESFVFLEEATGKSRSEILVNERNMKKEDFFKFRDYLNRRIKGEPWQYIIGKVNFLGFDIFSEKGVFIPRPETEWMTVQAIEKLSSFDDPLVLEIGSGSGAIGVAIASNVKRAKIVATDISKEALGLCKKNIEYHNLSSRVDLIRANLMDCFDNSQIFDMIISNPPYIPEKELEKLDSIVKLEPEMALNGGVGGVSVINKILNFSTDKLKIGGFIFIELDSCNIPHLEVPKSINYSIHNDQYGRERILQGVKI
jgi:release factor glutamine methyltransferase